MKTIEHIYEESLAKMGPIPALVGELRKDLIEKFKNEADPAETKFHTDIDDHVVLQVLAVATGESN